MTALARVVTLVLGMLTAAVVVAVWPYGRIGMVNGLVGPATSRGLRDHLAGNSARGPGH